MKGCDFFGSKRYLLSKERCCLMSSKHSCCFVGRKLQLRWVQVQLFSKLAEISPFLEGVLSQGTSLQHICWTFQIFNCWNCEIVKAEAEVWTLTVFRSEFLHPHHAQHPSEACLAKLLVWCIEDWIRLTAIFFPFVSVFSMYAAYMGCSMGFLLRINPCFKKHGGFQPPCASGYLEPPRCCPICDKPVLHLRIYTFLKSSCWPDGNGNP